MSKATTTIGMLQYVKYALMLSILYMIITKSTGTVLDVNHQQGVHVYTCTTITIITL